MRDLEYYKQRFYVFYNYLVKKQGATFLLEQTKELVDKAYEKKNKKRLSKIDKELDVWLREMLMPLEKDELLQILEKELYEDSEAIFLNKIEQVVSKGKINSKAEYEIVLQRVESIYDKKGSESEVKKLNRLLTDFHK
ncbi:MAG: hypothetical protein JXR82_02135 [Marinifilaceae bacterium]|nr:hypothetical protein [Marinifilaceae bacterium]